MPGVGYGAENTRQTGGSYSSNAMIALREKFGFSQRSGVALGAFAMALCLSCGTANAQNYGQTHQSSVEVDLSVLDALGRAPSTPSLDLYGKSNSQLDLYGTIQARSTAVSEDSVLLLTAPDTIGTPDSVLMLNQPAATSTSDFEFPTVNQSVTGPNEELAPVAIVRESGTTTVVETQVMVETEPTIRATPETEVVTVVEPEAEVIAVIAPEPSMTMDGIDVAVVSTEDAEMGSEDIRILFQPNDDSLTAEDRSVLRGLAGRLDAAPNQRIQLRAYASSEGTSASDARRLALSRALAVRAYLIENNVRSTRIDVRALGDKAESGPLDRIDIVHVER